jgi:hypothetical protein
MVEGQSHVFIHLKCYEDIMVYPSENVTGGTMSFDDEIIIDKSYKYLRKMYQRYQNVTEKIRSKLLYEMQEITGYHRKHLP